MIASREEWGTLGKKVHNVLDPYPWLSRELGSLVLLSE